MTSRRNPQDATRRNVQAANKKLAIQGARLRGLRAALSALARRVARLEAGR